MRVDSHAHVFTLNSILSAGTLEIFETRLRELLKAVLEKLGVSNERPAEMLAEAIIGALEEHVLKPEYLDERRLYKKLLEHLTGIQDFDDAVSTHFPDGQIKIWLDGDLDDLAVDAIREIISSVLDQDAPGFGGKVLDILDTLRLSMQSTITDVVDDQLEFMDADGLMIALMLDVYGGPESEEDRHRYLMQIQGHEEAALQRPGRVLPFFGVHPDRPGVLAQLKEAVEQRGFVGVKLYPSLSPPGPEPITTPVMKDLYRYCIERDLPILLHCGHGGFYRAEDTKGHCDPTHWESIVGPQGEFRDLRVCFAHFGGAEALSEDKAFEPVADPNDVGDKNWSAKIMRYMRDNPNVYTDLAKHVDMFEDDNAKKAYFDGIDKVNSDVGRPCVLFGTDAWLLRMDMPFDEYWHKWRQECQDPSRGVWDAITIDGPQAFLRLQGTNPTNWGKNIQGFVAHMRANRLDVGRDPARWLADAVDEPFVTGRDEAGWHRHRQPVRDAYQFLGMFLTSSRREAGFVHNPNVRLNELTYFDPGDPNFGGHCRDLARRIISFVERGDQFTDPTRIYRGTHDFNSAVELFVGIFREGELRLRDVAMTLDSVFDYKPGRRIA